MLSELRRIATYGKGSPRNRKVASLAHAALWPILLIPRLFWPARQAAGTIRKILLIRIDGIGDLSMSSAGISALRRKFPDAQIDLLTSDAAKQIADLMAEAAWLNNVYIIPLYNRKLDDYRAVWKQCLKQRYDAGLDLRGDLRNVLLMWLSGIPTRLAQHATGLTYLATDLVDLPEPHHQAAEAAALVEKLGAGPVDRWPRLPLREQDFAGADRWLDQQGARRDRPICAFHLSASIQARIWPVERFAAVAVRLRETFDAQIVVIGGKGEIELAERFAQLVGAPVIIATGKLSLVTTAALLSRCAVMIGNDSGPAHLAAYSGCPVVDLFSNYNPARTRPLSPNAVVLVPSHPCDPRCDKVCAVPDHQCILDHTVDKVFVAAEKLIRRHWRAVS